MLNNTIVTDIANIPNSYIELEYTNMQSIFEYGNREYCLAFGLS
ncbi:hypothetical protein SDC9_108602 [bioreactor metagenome]|uniref:Uncharacterized protein n=1 Tax=bioreactor metagenome TaxID=1076179 RepID=A0A645B8K1_9ZZZZ